MPALVSLDVFICELMGIWGGGILVCDWPITSHVTQITRSDWSVTHINELENDGVSEGNGIVLVVVNNKRVNILSVLVVNLQTMPPQR